MANHKGSEGSVKVGSDAIAELKEWSFNETADVIEDTTMGDAARTFQPSLTGASGSCSAFWDETNTAGQGALTAGAAVTLNMYPEGSASTDVYFTGSVIITSIDRSASFDGYVEVSFGWTANGAITQAAVA